MAKFAIQKDGPDIVCAITGLVPEQKKQVRAEYQRLFGDQRYIAGMQDGFMGPITSTDEARQFLGALEESGMTFEWLALTRLQISKIPEMLSAIEGSQRG